MKIATLTLNTKTLAILASILASGPASGANITFGVPVDLDTLTFLDESQIFAPPGANLMTGFFFAPDTVRNGDSVSLTFSFVNGKKMKISDLGPDDTFEQISPWLLRLGSEYDLFEIVNAQIDLLDATVIGEGQKQKSIAQQIDGVVHLGPTGYGWLGPDSSVTFSGIRARFDVVNIPLGEGSYTPWLNIYAEGFQILSSPVPDAGASGLLLLTGLGLLWAVQRKTLRLA